jgi:gag-polypeptide of LTR copia-type
MNKKFHSTTMKQNQDPDIFITDLETMKTKMCDLGHKIDEKALILHIMNNLSPDYATEDRFLEQRMQTLKEAGKELTVEDVRNQLTVQYIRLKHQEKPVMDHAMYMGNRFNGKCHFCGKIGHKATECHQKKNSKNNFQRNYSKNNNTNNSSNRQYNGNQGQMQHQNQGKHKDRRNPFCNYCHKKGHIESECRKKKRENSNPDDQMNIMVSELACMAFEIPTEDTEMPTVGSCVNCGRWGPAFVECGYCGEDSGCIYVPDSSVDYDDPDQEPKYDDYEEEETLNDDEISEVGYQSFNDIPAPTYVTKWHPHV